MSVRARACGGVLAVLLLALGALPAPALAQREDAAPVADAWWGEDKVRHFAASAAITGFGYGGGRVLLERDGASGVAIGVAAVAGLLRELHDHRDGRFSYRDLVWDALGIALGYLWIREIE